MQSVEKAADVAYFPQELKDISKLLNMASFKPGDEYALFEEFARQENIFVYFCIKGQGSKPADAEIKTEYMLDALRLFDSMTPEEIENVARECAFKGMSGIKTAAGATYTLKCFPNKQFSGYELLAYYYVSWAQAFPEMLLETGLPFHHAYEMAKRMREKEK